MLANDGAGMCSLITHIAGHGITSMQQHQFVNG